MYPTDPIYTINMNDQQRGWFYAEYERARKDEVIGVLLAIFLGRAVHRRLSSSRFLICVNIGLALIGVLLLKQGLQSA